MALDAKRVYIGTPDQSATTGAVLRGDVMTTIPADIEAALTAIASFTNSGYVSSDGVTLSTELSTNDLQEWKGSVVRKLMESFTGTITPSQSVSTRFHSFSIFSEVYPIL